MKKKQREWKREKEIRRGKRGKKLLKDETERERRKPMEGEEEIEKDRKNDRKSQKKRYSDKELE